MRRGIFLFLLVLATGLSAAPRGERAAFFTPDTLPELTLRVPPAEWNALLAAYDKNRRAIPYVKADCLFKRGGRTERIKDVGLRIRGGAFSRIRPELGQVHVPDAGTFRQAHFKISFSKFKKNRRIHGMRALNIKMFNGDPALVREVFAMDFLRRAGVPLAHYSSFVRLKIHILSDRKPVPLGVFRMNEVVDGTFITDRFPGTKPGWLWKCLWPGDLRAATVKAGRAPMGTGEGGRITYELKTRTKELAKGKDAFLRFMQELETVPARDFVAWTRRRLDTEMLIRTMAATLLLGHWDSYRFNNNNYYFYIDRQERGHFIPYDLDNVLGTSLFDSGRVSVWSVSEARPLVKRLLEVPQYRERYRQELRRMLDPKHGLFDPGAASLRIMQWQQLIEPHLANATGERQTIQDAPGPWGRTPQYRLHDTPGGENYFRVRRDAALAQLVDDKLVLDTRTINNPPPEGGGPPVVPRLHRDKSGFMTLYPGMCLRGYFNSWGAEPMRLVADHVWEGVFSSPVLPKYGFKIATGSAWDRDLDWGEAGPENDGTAEPNTGSGKHIRYPGAGKFRVRFNEKTLAYVVERTG